MKLVFTSYVSTPEYSDPGEWLKRIEGFTGVPEKLSGEHEVTCIERINFEGECEQNGVRYVFFRQRSGTSRFPFRMHRLIKAMKPDIVFVQGFIFPLQLVQLKLALGARVKIIVFNRSEKPFHGLKRYMQKWADKCVDAHLFSSLEFAAEWTRRGNIRSREKIHEVLHGSSIFVPGDKVAARSSLGIKHSPVFLWVGRLDANKDPLTVLKAFARFLREKPDARLYMIYHTEDLLNQVNGLLRGDELLGHAVNLIGSVKHHDLQQWYNSADFIISGSHYEGGGIAVCEAMSCGCVPVLTDIVAFRKMTGPGKCGILYEPGNENALLPALRKTVSMNLEEERNKTLRQFSEQLSFDAIAQKINGVIASL